MNKLIVTILLLPLILFGCFDGNGAKRNQNVQEKVGTIPASKESTWSTVPTPGKVIVYNEGKSRVVQTNDPKYNDLVKETDTILKNINLSSADMYMFQILNGDISGYRGRCGVELIYNSPFDLTINSSKVSVYRMFIYINDKPMLFIGSKETENYTGNSLGPLVISNTNSLKQLVGNLVNDATAKSN